METSLSNDTLVRVCSTADVEAGVPKRIIVTDQPAIALCQIEDGYFAVADLCTHGLASLCDGDIDGDQIFCPFHGGAFSLRDGKPTERPCTIAIKTWPVIVQDGDIFIDFSAA